MINGFKLLHFPAFIGLLTLGAVNADGQKITPINMVLPEKFIFFPPKPNYPAIWKNVTAYQKQMPVYKPAANTYAPNRGFSPSAAKNHWGWFCHAEDRFRKKTGIPLYVRLGSVEQTNRLEGK